MYTLLKLILLVGLCCVAHVGLAQNATSPPTRPAQAAQPASIDEVIVTGTRIVRDGFQAPTPLTVLSAEDVAASGAKNISEFVQEIPSVAGSWDLQSRSRFPPSTSGGGTGLATPALRNLGTTRTLILLDGQRAVPATETGEVDISNFPQMLISRVDVVTGGASAAYGSDAVSGVINYILDRQFTGLRAEVAGGISDYGDDENGTFKMAAGTAFAGGRGHFLFSGELYESKGVRGFRDGSPPKRMWMYNPNVLIENPAYTPTNGQSFYVVLPDLANSRAIKGALINAGPLRGTAFGEGGAPFQLNFGPVVNGGRMSGGDWELSELSGYSTIDPSQRRNGVFSRASFALTERFNVFAQFGYNRAYTESSFCCWADYNVPIRIDNAFLDPGVRARGVALGVTTFPLGIILDQNHGTTFVTRWVNRYVVGAEGNFGAFGRNWQWNSYYQYGESRAYGVDSEQYLRSRWVKAIDAVVSPTTGATVCRVKLTDPSDPCQPYNPFGWGVRSDAAVQYVGLSDDDGSWSRQTHVQKVAAFSITGEPFSFWAGPVSLAFGAERRSESHQATVDPFSLITDWNGRNNAATNGSINVNEGFLETLVPLAQNKAWAKALEFNGAVRATDYSTSGFVATWKAGLTWSPIDDLRIRATRSRDIRAPNISESYASGVVLALFLNDPFTGTVGRIYNNVTSGNLALKPEKADTTGIGLVLQPTWLPGFSASVDYYDIVIDDAIAVTGDGQQAVDQCFAGRQTFCDTIRRGPDGEVASVFRQPINFQTTINRGIDFEVGYNMPVSRLVSSWNGALSFRWLATHYLKAYTDDGITPPVDIVGQAGLRSWRHRFSMNYAHDPISFNLSARAVSAGQVDNTYIECDTGCPTSTVDHRTVPVGFNHTPGYLLFDTALTYKLGIGSGESEIFVNVRNLANKDPPRIPGLSAQGTRGNRGTDDTTYDLLGRTYRLGMRIKF